MSKLRVDNLTGVSETLLIPLHHRVEESRAESNAFKDLVAERFHDAIAYDWAKFQNGALQRLGIVARTEILDAQVKAFIAGDPDALIVNLGAGLDTRFHRLDNSEIEWIELDLPPVIAFRENLGEPANPRHTFLAASILDPDRWIPEVKKRVKSRVLFVAEGLFPYFTQAQHKEIFAELAGNFPGQDMLFHTSAPSVMQSFRPHSALAKAKMNAELQWGLEEGAEVSRLHPRVRFLAEFPLLTGYEKMPLELREQVTPDQFTRAAKIVHVRFD